MLCVFIEICMTVLYRRRLIDTESPLTTLMVRVSHVCPFNSVHFYAVFLFSLPD